MKTRHWKVANILIWTGVGLLILGIIAGFPTFYPYLATLTRTNAIPTAPPLDAEISPREEVAVELLPFEGEEERYSAPGAALEGEPDTPDLPPTATATPLPASEPAPVEETGDEIAEEPQPTATPTGVAPVHLQIPALNLEAPVIPIGWEEVNTAAGPQPVWQVPDWKAAGWHRTSALLGEVGNTVLNGHNTTRGEVFRDLYQLEEGDRILIEAEDATTFAYAVEAIYTLEEAGQPLEVRVENARYIQATLDERLTLVTCHPYGSTRYRLIVIARPAGPPDDPKLRRMMDDH